MHSFVHGGSPIKSAPRTVLLAIPLLVLLALAVSAFSNIGLPTRSRTVERLDEAEKARLAEMTHLRQALGDRVWPGWGQADIPVIVHNEAYAFLVGYPGTPPEGWTVVPSGERRGEPWEVTPDDTFQGQPYYRQPLHDPDKTPENFTVQVGNRWVATLQTREYSRVAFFAGFRRDLPGFLRTIVPYRLLWRLIMGDTETYIGALAHEAYHAYQGMGAEQRLAEAERVARLEGQYPWDQEEAKVVAELSTLHEAAKAPSDAEAAQLARQFLAQREERRAAQGLSPELADYERKREWLEGLAKHAELALQREAGRAPDYEPLPAIAQDRDFHGYRTRERFWTQQLGEVSRSAHREGEVRFYYSGMAHAALLDRLMPDWKARAWSEGVWLEELLAEAVGTGN
jgi:hypothetical protein